MERLSAHTHMPQRELADGRAAAQELELRPFLSSWRFPAIRNLKHSQLVNLALIAAHVSAISVTDDIFSHPQQSQSEQRNRPPDR